MRKKALYANERGLELGLTQEQVKARNFGYHTIHAIEADLQKGMDLHTAYLKYQYLEPIQIKGMTEHGLDRDQVRTQFFGDHTLRALQAVRNADKELSLSRAFDKVKAKTPVETHHFLKTGEFPPVMHLHQPQSSYARGLKTMKRENTCYMAVPKESSDSSHDQKDEPSFNWARCTFSEIVAARLASQGVIMAKHLSKEPESYEAFKQSLEERMMQACSKRWTNT